MAANNNNGFALLDKLIIDYGENVTDPTTTARPTTPSFLESGIVLDVQSDLSEDWNLTETQQYCTYAETETDFDYAWGCPINFDENEVSPAGLHGYWSTCKLTACDIIYHGPNRPKPVSILVHAFLKGDSKITITAKRSPTDTQYKEKIATILPGGGNSTRIPLEKYPDATVNSTYKYSVISFNDLLLFMIEFLNYIM